MTKEENIRAILETNFAGFREDIIESAVKMIMRLEVRNGWWTKIGHIENTWLVSQCSECGYQTIDAGSYCPNCGAKMDTKEGKKHD